MSKGRLYSLQRQELTWIIVFSLAYVMQHSMCAIRLLRSLLIKVKFHVAAYTDHHHCGPVSCVRGSVLSTA